MNQSRRVPVPVVRGIFTLSCTALLSACSFKGEDTIEQKEFSSPEAAAAALVAAVRAEDLDEVEAILGPGSHDIVRSGDDVADREARRLFLEAQTEKSSIEPAPDGAKTLVIGSLEWPFPVPIVKSDDGWIFDSEAAQDEILDRRIGRNELNAIQVCLACFDAERQYVLQDRDGDGILEYAQRFGSSPGKKDGLFWETAPGEEPSPLGPLVAKAVKQGYNLDRMKSKAEPYHGYLYRILKAQGPNAEGGAYEYLAGDNMIGGFALVAYPASYGVSGVKTFITSHDGVVYEKDLGDDTEKVAEALEVFDPDASWTKVQS